MAQPAYAFRPAKHIQRLMVVDACRRLRAVAPLKQYEYLGFGGFEFVDFELFHRSLGIDRMVSIEKNEVDEQRYVFNKPFADIDLRMGHASDYLPFIDRDTLRIVWLDYTQRLDVEVLQDAQTAAELLRPGSVLIITVNSVPGAPAATRRAQLVEDVCEERIPIGVDNAALAKWGLSRTQRHILLEEIREALGRRRDGATFEQLFNFEYADRAQMRTLGGMIVTDDVRTGFDDAVFDELSYVRQGGAAFKVSVPVLTAKEAIYLNRQLPLVAGAELKLEGLRPDDADSYAQMYRWYPPIPTPL